MKLLMRRSGGALMPDGDESWDIFQRLKQHKTYLVRVTYQRNGDLLRKYWALAALVADFDPGFDDREDADHYARTMIPWMRKEYVSESGRVTIRPKSIAEDEMDEATFERFYEAALRIWSERIGRDVETLRNLAAERANTRRAPGGDEGQ